MLNSNFTHRVMIVGGGSLFDDGIAKMLTERSDLLLSRAIYSGDFSFLDNIKSDQPDVILVCESGSLEAARIFDQVSSHPMLAGLCIIIIKLRNNVIDVYPRAAFVAGKISSKPRKINARTSDDLVSAFSN